MARTHPPSEVLRRPGGARPEALAPRVRVLLALAPAGLFAAHLGFGANQLMAALWLTLALALGLGVALSLPQARAGLAELRLLTPVAVLFVAVLAVAAWSLTPWTPGGPHPIWAWAGLEPGAATINRSVTVEEMIKLAGLACAFSLGCVQGARRVHAQATVNALLVLGAVYAAISLLTFLAGAQVAAGGRLSGGLMSANNGATVFGLLTVIGLAALLRRWRRTAGWDAASVVTQIALPLAAMLLFVTCLILTGSRMGVAATAFACAVLIVWDSLVAKGRRRTPLAAAALLLGVTGVLALRGADTVWARMEHLTADAEVRGVIFDAHWRAFLDSPLFGYGLGTFNDVNAQIMTLQNQEILSSVRALHNVYLQWLVEAGVVGSAPMFLLIALIVIGAIQQLGRISTGRTLLRGLIAANLVVLIHGLSDYALQAPSIAAFWAFLLGLQFAFGQNRA